MFSMVFGGERFFEEKRIWQKDSGRMYAHNIISWHKDEQITPEQALEFGKEFAETWFAGFQTLVAVHKDKDHIHCHFVTNSVSYLDGHKLHNSKKDLEKMKQLTNQMCLERGLSVAEKGRHFDNSEMEVGTIIAWNKDKYNLLAKEDHPSYLVSCAMAVIETMESCTNQEAFIRNMAARGWKVTWKKNRKYITFEDEAGNKVRDRNLAKTFHLKISKEDLEHEFTRQENIRAGGNTDDILRDIRTAAGDSQLIISESTADRRKSEASNQSVTAAENKSIAAEEQRQLEEQRRIDAESRAREARKRNRRRSEPER